MTMRDQFVFCFYIVLCIFVFSVNIAVHGPVSMYEVCLKSKCTDFLFKCLLDSPEITSDLLQTPWEVTQWFQRFFH